MKKKIVSILFIIVLLSCLFNNISLAYGKYTVSGICTTSNVANNTLMKFYLPDNISSFDNFHFVTCWSGLYKNNCLYVAKSWNSSCMFVLNSNYKKLTIWDNSTSSTLPFDLYVYDNGDIPTYYGEVDTLDWNGLIYEDGGIPNIFLTSDDVYFGDGILCNVASEKITFDFIPDTIYPAISNTAEDLATGTFDYILVAPGTFSNSENIGLNIYNITNLEDGEDVYSRKPIFSTTLNSSSNYYNAIVVEDQTEFWYEIPRGNLNIDFKNGNTYFYSLLLDGSPIQEVQATIGGLTEEDILNNNFDNLQSSLNTSNKELQETIKESNKELQSSIDKQTEAIEENNKTSKNIFEKIGEILSYLNPFSENFFAYKLVELIVDGLKSLFIPGDDFFSLYFDDLNNWFSDRLGFLYYPLELLFDLLDRFLNINFAEPIINIPDIKEPFTNVTLIKPTSFNFNDLLENETLKNVHDIYFIIIDAFIYIGLVGLLYRKYEEVMTK